MISTGSMRYTINGKEKDIQNVNIQIIPIYAGLLIKNGVDRIDIKDIASNKEVELIYNTVKQYFKTNGIIAAGVNKTFGQIGIYKTGYEPSKFIEISEEIGYISIEVVSIQNLDTSLSKIKI